MCHVLDSAILIYYSCCPPRPLSFEVLELFVSFFFQTTLENLSKEQFPLAVNMVSTDFYVLTILLADLVKHNWFILPILLFEASLKHITGLGHITLLEKPLLFFSVPSSVSSSPPKVGQKSWAAADRNPVEMDLAHRRCLLSSTHILGRSDLQHAKSCFRSTTPLVDSIYLEFPIK